MPSEWGYREWVGVHPCQQYAHARLSPAQRATYTSPPPRINFLSQSNMNVLDVNVMANINNLWLVSGEPV